MKITDRMRMNRLEMAIKMGINSHGSVLFRKGPQFHMRQEPVSFFSFDKLYLSTGRTVRQAIDAAIRSERKKSGPNSRGGRPK